MAELNHRYLTRSRGRPKKNFVVEDELFQQDEAITPKKSKKTPGRSKLKRSEKKTESSAFARSQLEAKGLTIETDFNYYTNKEIRKILRELGYNAVGNKKVIVERLQEAVKQAFEEVEEETLQEDKGNEITPKSKDKDSTAEKVVEKQLSAEEKEKDNETEEKGEASKKPKKKRRRGRPKKVKQVEIPVEEPVEEIEEASKPELEEEEEQKVKEVEVPVEETAKEADEDFQLDAEEEEEEEKKVKSRKRTRKSVSKRFDLEMVPIKVLKQAAKVVEGGMTVYKWDGANIDSLSLKELKEMAKLLKIHVKGGKELLQKKAQARFDEVADYLATFLPSTPLSVRKKPRFMEKVSAVVSVPSFATQQQQLAANGDDRQSLGVEFDARSVLATQLAVIADSEKSRDIVLEQGGMEIEEYSRAQSKREGRVERDRILNLIDQIERTKGFTDEDIASYEKLLLQKKATLLQSRTVPVVESL